MEKLHQNASETYEYSSLFHDMRSLDGGKNNLFLFFQEVCTRLSLAKKNTQKNNILFQEMMCFYDAGQNLEYFLSGIWFELEKVFFDLSECKIYLKENLDIFEAIKKWDLHMAIMYQDMTPVWIVFAKQIQGEKYIQEQAIYFYQQVVKIVYFNT